ncbi:response regulator [Rummeliibacillus sp. NPDC094406]|uniref:response regulator n=1 Tax=Rummeliibacillus sp. NPDC094406 TaxID=3364511 RepID=UPI0037F1EC06
MKIKTVIAEDDFRVAEIHEKFLGTFKEIEVIGKALNGKEAIQLLEELQPDLLLLDVYMPDQLGTDLLPIIRQQFPQTDIIMVTAATDKELFEKALHYGVEYFLIKPVKLDRFKQTIEEYINKHQLMHSCEEVNQDFVDLIYKRSPTSSSEIKESSLPKGIDEITLVKVRNVVENSPSSLSAEDVGVEIGASRTTARRYLEYLASIKSCKAEVVYGAVGRPERKYCKI